MNSAGVEIKQTADGTHMVDTTVMAWIEINAAMQEHKAGLLTYSEVMDIVRDVKVAVC